MAEAREEARDREENQNLLVEVEGELAAARARLADAAADARDLEELRDRLVLAQGRLAAAQERERGLERALQDERRRKFLLITISWDRDDDVDLHIVDPGGREYYYAARRHAGSPAQFEEDTIHGPGNEVWLHPAWNRANTRSTTSCSPREAMPWTSAERPCIRTAGRSCRAPA